MWNILVKSEHFIKKTAVVNKKKWVVKFWAAKYHFFFMEYFEALKIWLFDSILKYMFFG